MMKASPAVASPKSTAKASASKAPESKASASKAPESKAPASKAPESKAASNAPVIVAAKNAETAKVVKAPLKTTSPSVRGTQPPSKKQPVSGKRSGLKSIVVKATLPSNVPSIWSPVAARFQITVLLLGVVYVNTMVRNTLSMGIVCMVNHTAQARQQENKTDDKCGGALDKGEQSDGPLLWDSHEQGAIVAAVFWGGLLPGIPAGYLADRHSPKWIIAFCMFLNVAGCALTPIAAEKGKVPAVIALRFIMGLGGQATIFPTATALNARWIPPSERTTAMALFTTGAQAAMVIGGPLNARLCKQSSIDDQGWKDIFYYTAMSVAPILLFWVIFAADTPTKYRWIKKPELRYIQQSLAEQHLQKEVSWKEVPWKQMCLSPPVLVAFLSMFALSAMVTTFQAFIPLYLKQSLRLDLTTNGYVNALIFIAQLLGKFVSAPIADRLRHTKAIGDTLNCKIFNSIGAFGGSAFMIAASYMTCKEVPQAIAYLSLCCLLFSFQLSGFLTALLAMAPVYTGILNSLSRFFGEIGSVIMPHIVAELTPTGADTEWRNVCWLMSGLLILAGALFLAFGSGEIQSWAKREKKEEEEEEAGQII